MNEIDKRGRATMLIVKEKLRKGIEPSALQKHAVAEWLRDASEQVMVPPASLLLSRPVPADTSQSEAQTAAVAQIG